MELAWNCTRLQRVADARRRSRHGIGMEPQCAAGSACACTATRALVGSQRLIAFTCNHSRACPAHKLLRRQTQQPPWGRLFSHSHRLPASVGLPRASRRGSRAFVRAKRTAARATRAGAGVWISCGDFGWTRRWRAASRRAHRRADAGFFCLPGAAIPCCAAAGISASAEGGGTDFRAPASARGLGAWRAGGCATGA